MKKNLLACFLAFSAGILASHPFKQELPVIDAEPVVAVEFAPAVETISSDAVGLWALPPMRRCDEDAKTAEIVIEIEKNIVVAGSWANTGAFLPDNAMTAACSDSTSSVLALTSSTATALVVTK